MHIEIHIPRSAYTLALVALAGWLMAQNDAVVNAVGGNDAATTVALETNMQQLRTQQQSLLEQEEILRAQLTAIERELEKSSDPVLHQTLRLTRNRIISLIEDRNQAEELMRQSLQQLWEAQNVAQQVSIARYEPERASRPLSLRWPVKAKYGVSAYFRDAAYKSRFGLAHNAIDIPIEQGSTINAAASGIVEKVSDNGLGYSSLVISHADGYATVYGHVSGFLVEEGQHVIAGEPVAHSGGRPGSKGAGSLTTGPHLHFELLHNGGHVDPMGLLPAL